MDSRTLEEAIEQYYGALYLRAFAILRQANDAEDAVQTACMKAWEHHSDISIKSSCEAWLFSIVHNVSISILRKRHSHVSYSDEIAPANSTWYNETPEELVGYWNVKNEIMKLTPVCRQAIILRGYYGYPVQTIAGVLAIPRATVSARIRRARIRLGAALSE